MHAGGGVPGCCHRGEALRNVEEGRGNGGSVQLCVRSSPAVRRQLLDNGKMSSSSGPFQAARHSGPETDEGGQNSGHVSTSRDVQYSARIERMTPSMDCFENKESIDRVALSIRALFNDSGGRNMPRVLRPPSPRFLAHGAAGGTAATKGPIRGFFITLHCSADKPRGCDAEQAKLAKSFAAPLYCT